MHKEIVESLWENFRRNYKRFKTPLGLPEYEKVIVEDDIAKSVNELITEMNKLSLKNSWNRRYVSCGKNLLFLLHKINGIQENKDIREEIDHVSKLR